MGHAAQVDLKDVDSKRSVSAGAHKESIWLTQPLTVDRGADSSINSPRTLRPIGRSELSYTLYKYKASEVISLHSIRVLEECVHQDNPQGNKSLLLQEFQISDHRFEHGQEALSFFVRLFGISTLCASPINDNDLKLLPDYFRSSEVDSIDPPMLPVKLI